MISLAEADCILDGVKVCDVQTRLRCGIREGYDPVHEEACRVCLLDFFHKRFPKETAKVKKTEAVFRQRAGIYNLYVRHLRAFLGAKRDLHNAAVRSYGHAQLHGVLDPYIDIEELDRQSSLFCVRAYAKGVLIEWYGWRRRYALNVEAATARALYSTKNVGSDVF